MSSPSQQTKEKYAYEVTIMSHGKKPIDQQAVEICANGKTIVVPRGVPCKMTAAHFHALNDALHVTSVRDKDGKVSISRIPAYPFSSKELRSATA